MTTTGWRRQGLALLLAGWLSTMPVAAQTAVGGPAPDVLAAARVSAQLAQPASPAPVTASIRTAALLHSDGLTQTAPPRRRTVAGCVGRVAIFGALGAVAGLAAAGTLLASTGGSDDTGGILRRYGLAGAGVGAVVGAALCAI